MVRLTCVWKGIFMLVLSRKINEEVQIGGDCTIKVVRIGNGCVRLGICAPKGVAVVRRELLDSQDQADESDKADDLSVNPLADVGGHRMGLGRPVQPSAGPVARTGENRIVAEARRLSNTGCHGAVFFG